MDQSVTSRKTESRSIARDDWIGPLAILGAVWVLVWALVFFGFLLFDQVIPQKAMLKTKVWTAFVCASFVVLGALVLAILKIDWRKVLQRTEEQFHIDLDRDGHIGKPPMHIGKPPMIELTINRPSQGRWERFELPGTQEAFHKLASGLLAGRGFTEASWIGKGRPYTKPEFHNLRDELLERGLLRWRNEKSRAQGIDVTEDGQAVFEEVIQTARTHARARTGDLLDLPVHRRLGRGVE